MFVYEKLLCGIICQIIKKIFNKDNERVYFKKCFYIIQNRILKVVMKKKYWKGQGE